MNIMLITGSNREISSSTQLAMYMAERLRDKQMTAEIYNLWSNPLPMYAPDRNTTNDENTIRMLETADRADAFVLATPEYHGSLSGVLKNALDYMGSVQFSGKPVLSASSAGGAVGVSSLTQMHAIVRNLHGINCSEWVSIGGDQRKFTEDNQPVEDSVKLRVERALDELLHLCSLLRK